MSIYLLCIDFNKKICIGDNVKNQKDSLLNKNQKYSITNSKFSIKQ